MDIVTHRADSSEQARNLRFDFANTGAVGMCTHYDYVEHGTSKEDEDASMTQDALLSAMQRLQEAGGDVEYLDEANERHQDFVRAGGMAAFEEGTPEAEASARTARATAGAPSEQLKLAHTEE